MNTSDALYKAVHDFMMSVTRLPVKTGNPDEGIFTIHEREWNAMRDAMFAYHQQRQQDLMASGTWQRVQQEKGR